MKTITMSFAAADVPFIPGGNTFRVGDKYAELKSGDQVIAADSKDASKALGVFTVKQAYVLPLFQALEEHSVNATSNKLKGITDPQAAREDLLKILTPIYRLNGLAASHTVTCVVEFEPEAPTPAAE